VQIFTIQTRDDANPINRFINNRTHTFQK